MEDQSQGHRFEIWGILSYCGFDKQGFYTYYFKPRALMSPEHSTPSSACSLMHDLMLAEEGVGLHNLVFAETRKGNLVGSTYNSPGWFWSLVLNYNTFGTVAPLNQSCGCNFQKNANQVVKIEEAVG